MTDAERLRREYERLFGPGLTDAERAERRRRWVAALREAWDRLSAEARVREEIGALRAWVRARTRRGGRRARAR